MTQQIVFKKGQPVHIAGNEPYRKRLLDDLMDQLVKKSDVNAAHKYILQCCIEAELVAKDDSFAEAVDETVTWFYFSVKHCEYDIDVCIPHPFNNDVAARAVLFEFISNEWIERNK